MNKFSIGFVAFAASCATAFADGTGTVTQNGFSSGSGGEFTITQNTGYVGETNMFSDVFGAGTFETFCVQTGETFQPGSPTPVYNMVINTVTVLGGNPVDPRTAFLYTMFRTGALSGPYDYGAGRQASAGDLQQAIWFCQGQGGTNNYFVALAENVILNNLWSGVGDVRIINLTYADGTNAQDQLTLIPTPGSAALLGAGMLAASRRRRV